MYVCVCVCVRPIQCTVWINTKTTTPKLELFYSKLLEMWANAQRDGRPLEYRWRRTFNAAVWLCSNAAKTRNPLKIAGVPQTNETISAASGPKFTIL